MRIGIDARWIFRELTGIGTYTQELVRHLARHDRDNEYVLFFDHAYLLQRTAESTQFNTAPNFSAHVLPYGVFSLRNQIQFPAMLDDLHLDLLHSTNYMIPLRAFPRRQPGPIRCAITIHDLIPMIFPDHAPKSKKARLFPLYKRVMLEAAARADLIIAVSESSRADIVERLNIPPAQRQKVVVVPEGVGHQYAPSIEDTGEDRTILYVGRFDPYKNVVGVVEAFARIRADAVPEAQLRIIGSEDPRYPEARLRARELGVEETIAWSGHVSDDALKAAYQSAAVLVLASRYEGFGLPVIEAMACGTPVVCSNTSSLPEVAGDAAILIDPDKPESLANALEWVLTNPTLARELRVKGLRQAEKFTWAASAERTVKAYEQALL